MCIRDSYYAVAHLALRNFVVLGHDEAQARRMLVRLQNDPLVHLIASAFEVSFHPVALGADTDLTHEREGVA